MTRLIDADALKKAITDATYNFEQIPIRVDKVQEIIDNAPTVERPQGKWEKPFEMDGKSYHKCTNCHISSELILIDKYCPHCGAEIRKEAEE